MKFRIIVLLISFSILCSCSEHKQDGRLTDIAEMVSESPQEALLRLDSIDYDNLSSSDRHYYDFLLIKANDKAYITHESDSLICDIIKYYSTHDKDGIYPETLYYGGRVYSDLGDLPTSLHYFQSALDHLPANTANKDLRCTVLSQTGRLLDALSLYDEAIPYIKAALEINRQNKDSINIIYNLQLLGGTNLRAYNYAEAEKLFKQALRLSSNFPDYHTAKSKMYMAEVKLKSGQLDSALCYIRNTIDKVKPIVRNSALGYAANIYLKAGITDTAYIYAHELISNEDPTHKEIGYQVILSPELRKYSSLDSLNQYISNYRTILVDYYDNNQNKLAINQQNLYNYQLHEQGKNRAERLNYILKQWIIGFAFLLIILAFGILYFKNKNKANIIELHQAIDNIKKLKIELHTAKCSSSNICAPTPPDPKSPLITPKKAEKELRERLKSELMAIYKNSAEPYCVSPVILQSEAYHRIQELIVDGKPIKERDNLWNEIEQVVLEASPKFRTNLNLLTLGNLTTIDLHTALLIKCGIRPSKMMILLGRSNGAIVSRRETLCFKVLDKKSGIKVIDAIIRLL